MSPLLQLLQASNSKSSSVDSRNSVNIRIIQSYIPITARHRWTMCMIKLASLI